MNRRHAFLVLLMAIAAVMVLWTSRTTPEPPSEPALIPPATTYPKTSESESTGVTPASHTKEPQTTALTRQVVDDDVAVSQQFPNLGCRRVVTRAGDGTERVHVGCGRLNSPDLNTYAKRSSAELETLAQTDPRAALMLALRSQSFDRARTLKYVVRATALGGNDTTPLLWYMSNIKPASRFRTGKPSSLEKTKMNYVLSQVAESLGADEDYTRHAHWVAELGEQQLDSSAMASLDQQSDKMLANIERIQYEAGIAPTNAE